MREILFIGKREDNGEWIEGSLFTGDNGECEICYGTPRVRITYEVIPETVGQFTGLYDKSGTTKIFEGDIVHCVSATDEADMVVIFEDGEFRMVRCERYKVYISGWGFYAIRCFDKEIIGNIHDNPELLEGETE